jgi:hypothetical protein
MALALNVFQTVTAVVSTSPTVVYTAPVGYTGVVLLAQVANIGGSSQDVTFVHRRSSTDTEMLKQFPISSNDTTSLLAGKLVLESGDKLILSGSNPTDLKFVSSILETLN